LNGATCESGPQDVPEHPTHVPHGPEDYGLCFTAPAPIISSFYGTVLDPIDSLLHENINGLYCFAHHLHVELGGIHYLADGSHSLVMSQFHELSVKFNSLKEEHDHLINEHLLPLQQFAAGVISSLSVLTGQDPVIPAWPSPSGGCLSSPQLEQSQVEDRPPPVSFVSLDLQACELNPSNYSYVSSPSSSVSSSIPNLQPLSSSSKESLLHPSTPSSPRVSGEYCCLCYAPHWSNLLLDCVNFQNYYFLAREEAFILLGESGEPETVHSSESNALGSNSEASDGGVEVLAEEAGRTWFDDGSGGL